MDYLGKKVAGKKRNFRRSGADRVLRLTNRRGDQLVVFESERTVEEKLAKNKNSGKERHGTWCGGPVEGVLLTRRAKGESSDRYTKGKKKTRLPVNEGGGLLRDRRRGAHQSKRKRGSKEVNSKGSGGKGFLN